MTIAGQIRSRPLSLKVFGIWLFLTAIPLLAIGIDRLISNVDYYSQQSQWLIFSAFYVSAPLGGSIFAALGYAAIPVAMAAMTTSIFVVKGYRAAYYVALALLVVGVVSNILLFLLPAVLYALLANAGWIWILRRERIKAHFTK